MTPPTRLSSTASTSTETTTGQLPNPSARSVAISRVRLATAEYIVLTAPKTAPIPSARRCRSRCDRMIVCSTCDCWRNSPARESP